MHHPLAARYPMLLSWTLRLAFFAGLSGAIGTSLACAPAAGTLTTTTVTDYTSRQSAFTADPAPRAVGELAPDGKWLVEGGYDRTFVRTGPSRDAGGTGQTPTQDGGHLRVARGVGRGVEFGVFGQLSLSHKPGAADVAQEDFANSAWLAGFTARIRPRFNDVVAFVGGIQAAVGGMPWQRDIQAVTTTQSAWVPGDKDTKPWSETTIDKQRYPASSFAVTGSAQASVGLEFRLARQISLQVGTAAGLVPAVKGLLTTSTTCSSTYTYPPGSVAGACSGKAPDDLAIAHAESFLMPTAALTASILPVQVVLSGWWLAASTADFQNVTPGGLTFAVRMIL